MPARPLSPAVVAVLDDVEAHLRDHERLQPTAISNCTTCVAFFLAFLTPAEAQRATTGDVPAARLSAFLQHERERGMADSTLQSRWYAVHAFYRYLGHHGYDRPSPLDRVRAPRSRPVPRRGYSLHEAEALLGAARRSAEGGTKKGQPRR